MAIKIPTVQGLFQNVVKKKLCTQQHKTRFQTDPSKFSDLYCAIQDEVDGNWPWQPKTLLELVRGTGLHPEVNISGVKEYFFLRQILVLE